MDRIDAELIEQIATALSTTPEHAAQIIAAAQPLWNALEPMVDAYGGAEFHRVFPEAITTIHQLANQI